MTDKKQITVLLATMLVALGLVGGVFLWLANISNINLIKLSTNNNNLSQDIEKSNTESFAQVKNTPSGLFNYGGSTTWAPIRKEVNSAIQSSFPQFKLRYTEPSTGKSSSGTGLKMLLSNQLSFSQSSRSIKDEEHQKAEQRGFTLKEIPVAIDGIAIAVNPNLNIPGLTIAQLKDIYTGKVTNWQQVGGPNLAITLYSKGVEAGGGNVQFLVENVLEDKQLAANVQFLSTTTQALREVAKNPGGIFYASAPQVVGQCGVKALPLGRKPEQLIPPYALPLVPLEKCPQQRNQLNTTAFQSGEYPMTRRLFVIVKQNGQSDQQAGEAYADLLLTPQGQDLITKAGFVRIR